MDTHLLGVAVGVAGELGSFCVKCVGLAVWKKETSTEGTGNRSST